MIKRRRKDARGNPGIGLTPVLGIVFLILLFFAASVPFARERGIDVAAPWGEFCDCWPVVIYIDNQNRIFTEEDGRLKQIDHRRVRAVVARRLAEDPRSEVLLQAHRQADMGVVIRVADEAKKARISPPVPVSIAAVDS